MNKDFKNFCYGVFIAVIMISVYILIARIFFGFLDVVQIKSSGFSILMVVLSVLYFVVRLLRKDEENLWKLSVTAVYYMVLTLIARTCMNIFALPSLGSDLFRLCRLISLFITVCVSYYYSQKLGNNSFLNRVVDSYVSPISMNGKGSSNFVDKFSVISVVYFIFFAFLMMNEKYYHMLIPTDLVKKLCTKPLLSKAVNVWPKVIFCLLQRLLITSLIHSMFKLSSRLFERIQAKN